MAEYTLRHVRGRKIRKQYCRMFVVVLFFLLFAILYDVFVISMFAGLDDYYDWSSFLVAGFSIGLFLLLPLLILRVLNVFCIGRILCVINEEGIYFSTKWKLRWETIENIEYVRDTAPRFEGDSVKSRRAIVYSRGGRRIVLDGAPRFMLSHIRRYRNDIDIQILGAACSVRGLLILFAIILVAPLYVLLLCNAPGIPNAQLVLFLIVWILMLVIRASIFDRYEIRYRFWRNILTRKWLSYIVLGCYYCSWFVIIPLLLYFPGWILAAILGAYSGFVRVPVPSRRGIRRRFHIPTYEELYDTYITNSDYWEKRLDKAGSRKR